MASRRCSICGEDWPSTQAFKLCPDCGEPTWVDHDAKSKRLGVPPSVRLATPPHEIDRQCKELRRWLDTVGADDFRGAS